MPSGKPTFAKFGPKKQKAYLAALRQGCHRNSAAAAAGVSVELVRLYRKKSKAFAKEELLAEEDAAGRMEDALYAAGFGGNVTAMQVWLFNRCPDRWTDRRNLTLRGDPKAPLETAYRPRDPIQEALEIAGRLREMEARDPAKHGVNADPPPSHPDD